MRITTTVNLDHYENIKIESNEYDDLKSCLDEIKDALVAIGSPQTQSYAKRYLSMYAARIAAMEGPVVHSGEEP